MSDNRAIMKPPTTELAPGNFDTANVPAEIMQLAVALWASLGQDGSGISQADALKAAIHAERTGEVFGRDSYIGTQGKVKGQILEGYRAIQNRIETPYIVKYRPLTEDEATENEIKPGMRALICEVYVLDVWRRAQKMHVPYAPVCGLGILRPSDMTTYDGKPKEPPTGKTWRWVLEKRARKDALRQLPAWAREPFDWHEDDDEDDNAQTRRLAAAEQAAAEEAAHFQQLPPEEQRARLTSNVIAMRGAKTADPLGVDSPPQAAAAVTAKPPPDLDHDGWNELVGAAERIRARLLGQAQPVSTNGAQPDSLTLKKANGSLGILIRDDAKRRAVREWLCGVKNADELSAGQCQALIGWINARKQTLDDGSSVWLPAGQAVDELKVILAALQLDSTLAPEAE